MTTPRVIEMPRPMEPATPDAFLDPVRRREERVTRERRLERVRALLRNARRAGGTARA